MVDEAASPAATTEKLLLHFNPGATLIIAGGIDRSFIG
jgi:hypothetical protein